MKTEKIPLERIKLNEANPRTITEDKFTKLVNSILVLPKMLFLRPVVIDGASVALGGNMRCRALRFIQDIPEEDLRRRLDGILDFQNKTEKEKQAILEYWVAWKDKPTAFVIKASDLTDAEKREFIIKDNVGFGAWDWDMLANDWDEELLGDWGLGVWQPEDERKNDADGGGMKGDIEENMAAEKEQDTDYNELMLGDRIYPSDNEYDIPVLRMDRQPESGLLLPFAGWGTDTRAKKGIDTYHFYVDDYRFEKIWKDPTIVLNSGCSDLVEPNLSLFDTTPVAYGLQQIYKKRWISRYLQECGVRVYADLNVAKKFYKYNRMGIPDGYNAFATRGYTDRQEYLKMEIQIAREISGFDKPNMIVYGGGEKIKELCMQNNVLYVEQFMNNKDIKRKKKGVENE